MGFFLKWYNAIIQINVQTKIYQISLLPSSPILSPRVYFVIFWHPLWQALTWTLPDLSAVSAWLSFRHLDHLDQQMLFGAYWKWLVRLHKICLAIWHILILVFHSRGFKCEKWENSITFFSTILHKLNIWNCLNWTSKP